jgi:hypothetical protein
MRQETYQENSLGRHSRACHQTGLRLKVLAACEASALGLEHACLAHACLVHSAHVVSCAAAAIQRSETHVNPIAGGRLCSHLRRIDLLLVHCAVDAKQQWSVNRWGGQDHFTVFGLA